MSRWAQKLKFQNMKIFGEKVTYSMRIVYLKCTTLMPTALASSEFDLGFFSYDPSELKYRNVFQGKL